MPAENTPTWISLLIQVPLVGVFIWYSLKLNDQMMKAQERSMTQLDKHDEAFEKRNKSVIDALDSLNSSICAQLREIRVCQEDHDRFVRQNMTILTTNEKISTNKP